MPIKSGRLDYFPRASAVMTQIIIASTPAYGHFSPMRSIAAHAVHSGYGVTFLTGEQFRPAVDKQGRASFSLTGKANWDANRSQEFFPERRDLPAGSRD